MYPRDSIIDHDVSSSIHGILRSWILCRVPDTQHLSLSAPLRVINPFYIIVDATILFMPSSKCLRSYSNPPRFYFMISLYGSERCIAYRLMLPDALDHIIIVGSTRCDCGVRDCRRCYAPTYRLDHSAPVQITCIVKEPIVLNIHACLHDGPDHISIYDSTY